MGACQCTKVEPLLDTEEYALLCKTPFFLHLSDTQLHDLAARFVRHDVAKHTTVFKQGDAVDHLYAVASGKVALTVAVDSGSEDQKHRATAAAAAAENSISDTNDTELSHNPNRMTPTESLLPPSPSSTLKPHSRRRQSITLYDTKQERRRRSLFRLQDNSLLRDISRSSSTRSTSCHVRSFSDKSDDTNEVEETTSQNGQSAVETSPSSTRSCTPIDTFRDRIDHVASLETNDSNHALLPASTNADAALSCAAETIAADTQEEPASRSPSTVSNHMAKITTKYAGALFGGNGILLENTVSDSAHPLVVQAHNAVTIDDSVLFSISRSELLSFAAANGGDETTVKLNAALGTDLEAHLQQIPLFQGVATADLRRLSNMLHVVPLKAEEVLFFDGDDNEDGNSMYIVYDGLLQAVALDDDNTEKVLNTFEPGVFFGEIALLIDMPRTATVVARERSLLLELKKSDFVSFLRLNHSPTMEANLTDLLKKRIAESFRKYHVPFMSAIPPDKFILLARLCSIEQIPAGEVVFKEGDAGDSFYLMAHGIVSVSCSKRYGQKTKQIELCRLGPGSYFGEGALMKETERNATVTAESRCVMVSICRDNFKAFFAEVPEAFANFEIRLSKYSSSLSAVIFHALGRKYFRRHLKAEFSQENLDFWMCATNFQRTYSAFSTDTGGGGATSTPLRSKRATATMLDASLNPFMNAASPPPRQTSGMQRLATMPALSQDPSKVCDTQRVSSAHGYGADSIMNRELHPVSETLTHVPPENKRQAVAGNPSFRRSLCFPSGDANSKEPSDSSAAIKAGIMHAQAKLKAQEEATAMLIRETTNTSMAMDGEHAGNLGDASCTREEMVETATKLYDSFISDDCETPINVAHRVRDEIIDIMTSENMSSKVHPDMYASASQEVFILMEKDSFARFKSSKLFQQFLDENDVRNTLPSTSRSSTPTDDGDEASAGFSTSTNEAVRPRWALSNNRTKQMSRNPLAGGQGPVCRSSTQASTGRSSTESSDRRATGRSSTTSMFRNNRIAPMPTMRLDYEAIVKNKDAIAKGLVAAEDVGAAQPRQNNLMAQ
jgi:CRP-like cAMP-binding protein